MQGEAKPTLAVVGATGAVGTVMLEILSRRQDVWGGIDLLLASAAGRRRRGKGAALSWRGPCCPRRLTETAFDGVDVAMFDVPDEVSAVWAPIAVSKGVVVVDNSGAFRMDDDVPLVVPEVNARAARNRPRGIIANPNCTTLTMMDALGALHARWGLRELVVASYQAASGAGQAGVERLYDELEVVAGNRSLGQSAGDVRGLVATKLGDTSPFPAPLALNVISPLTGSLRDERRLDQQRGGAQGPQRVTQDPRHPRPQGVRHLRPGPRRDHPLARCPRGLRAGDPRRRGSGRQVLVEAPSVVVLDDVAGGDFPTPADVVGSDPTFVGRLRQALDFPNIDRPVRLR